MKTNNPAAPFAFADSELDFLINECRKSTELAGTKSMYGFREWIKNRSIEEVVAGRFEFNFDSESGEVNIKVSL